MRQTTTMMVAEELRRRILRGELAEGNQLRQEALARELGVSRIPVREALRQLDAEGLVTHVSHKGAVVSKLSVEEVYELFEIRLALEPWLLREAIPAMEELDLDTAQQLLDQMIGNENITEWGTLNWRFHEALYAPAKRRETLKILSRIHAALDRYVRLQIALTSGQLRAHQEHKEILDCCRQRDSDRAARLLETHIHGVKDGLRDHLDEQAGAGTQATASS